MKEEIQAFFRGEVLDDENTLKTYSHDASLFEIRPKLVVYPKNSEDLRNLVRWIAEHSKASLTVRAAGSCMSGGPLGESIVADVTGHMNKLIEMGEDYAIVEPGLLYKEFEPMALDKKLLLPCFPASKNLCALGGMIGNNCAGEKTLRWGKMEDFILETKVILADGNEYIVRPLSRNELMAKMRQKDFEGELYRKTFNLIESNKEIIEKARPRVSKNSAGYYLWNVWDGEIFDLNKLLVGSQGTLGMVVEAKVRLVPVEPVSKPLVIFLPELTHLAELVGELLPTEADSIESYDDSTLKLAFRFFPEMLQTLRPKHFFKLLLSFVPEGWMILRAGLPKLVVLAEYSGQTEEEVDAKLVEAEKKIKRFGFPTRRTRSEEEAEKYWTIRRESFNLLRKHVSGKRTAPFVDDVVVRPEDMPEFLPRMRKILDDYKLTYTIAGHAGNGNFHIIPLMDMRDKRNIDAIREVADKVYDLVAEYHGSITGEHNDGVVRTPYLGKMYSPEILELFKQTKTIFDSRNIFNPGKKVGGTLDYMFSHIASE